MMQIGAYYDFAADQTQGNDSSPDSEDNLSSEELPESVKSRAATPEDLDSFTVEDIDIGATLFTDDYHDHPSFTINDDAPSLYPNSALTSIQAVTILISWFSAFPGISKRSFSRLLKILHSLFLPKGNTLPTSYTEAIGLLKPYFNTVKEYHCCINDCILYRDTERQQYKSLCRCPVCGEDRYKPDSLIPRKIFKYYPITNRIKRMYGNSCTSQLLQSHGRSKDVATPTNSLHNSKAWRDLYANTGMFHGECRSLAFALCLDGVNPFAKEKVSYSMCPMLLVPLNLPRISSQSVMLTGIIPGPLEVKNTDPYIDVLIDEIIQMNKTTVYDAYQDELFTLEVTILFNILDYPGHNKVFHCQGIHACVQIKHAYT